MWGSGEPGGRRLQQTDTQENTRYEPLVWRRQIRERAFRDSLS